MHADKDILISRVVDDEATAEDWAALKHLAASDPTVWKDLAEAQYTSIGLGAALEEAIAIADGVDAPIHEHMRARLSLRAATAARWAGWAAAAAIALAWAGAGMPRGAPAPGPVSAGFDAPLVRAASAADAYRQYLELGKKSGQVVDEVPQLVWLQSRPQPGGKGFEVLYLRQVVERAVVNDLFSLGRDDAGRSVRVPLNLPASAQGNPM